MHDDVFFKPDGAWVGDVIPYQHNDEFLLYYLHEQRTSPKAGTPWHVVTTHDLVHFTDRGVALPSGGADAPDLNAYTGSIVTDDNGTHHLFYTGQNPQRCAPDGRPLQVVMHATSTDLATWNKVDGDVLGAPDGYDPADWRDPFVYRIPGEDRWQMVMAARHMQGPERRRGVVARLESSDLHTWSLIAPLWDPRRFVTQECPELFQMGQWWYLVYSEFTDTFVTRYRMARNPEGPWLAPEHDSLDGRSWYAAKSTERDGRRFFFGWIATREGSSDDGAWQWAGTLSALEAVPGPDGALAMRIPDEVLDHFANPTTALPAVALDSRTAFTSRTGDVELPSRCHLQLEIRIGDDTKEVGVLLHTSPDGETGYSVRLEPQMGRMVLDRWPRRQTGTEQWQVSGDVAHFIELERPANLAPGLHRLDVVLDGDIAVVNLDRDVTLSTRLYDHSGGRVGVFVCDGAAEFSDITLTTPTTH